MRRRYSREQWQEWIAEQQQGELSVTEFCRRKDVPENSFYHWRRKLSAEGETGERSQQKSDSPFVPVAITGSREVEIALPCGAMVRVPHDGPALQHVLKALLEIGSTA